MGRRVIAAAEAEQTSVDRALQARDAAAFAAAFTGSGVLAVKSVPWEISGAADIERYCAQVFAAFPDLTVTVVRRYQRQDERVDELLGSGTHRAEFLGRPATGRAVSVRARLAYRMSGDAIRRLEVYLDVASLQRQLAPVHAEAGGGTEALATGLLAAELPDRTQVVQGQAAGGAAEAAAPAAPAAAPVPPVAPVRRARHSAPADAGRRSPRRGGRKRALVVAAVLVLLGGGTAAALTLRSAHPRPAAAAVPAAPVPSASPSAAPSPSATPRPSATAPPTVDPGTLLVNGVPLLGLTRAQLAGAIGKPVTGRDVLVQQVAPRDGLWLGTPKTWAWLELADEVPFNPVLHYSVGQRVTFTGVLVANTPGFNYDARVDNFVFFQQAIAQGVHIVANYQTVTATG